MAKQLGMIHTVNYELGPNLAEGQKYLIDLPGQLTNQLQRMVRAAGYFKVVGIDMVLRNITGSAVDQPEPVAGTLSYYAPTRGRCEALKTAYQAVRKAMKEQGINIRGNRQYDFRVPMVDRASVVNGADFLNAATYDGTNDLTLNGAVNDGVFAVYNENIQPEQGAVATTFSSGFGIAGLTVTATDFVNNEGSYYEGSLVHAAELDTEDIPFVVSYGFDGTSGTSAAIGMEWRPDPALYLAILTGQLLVTLDVVPTGSMADYVLDTAVHVSGWKSVVSERRHKKSSSKKARSHGKTKSKK
jgi:hypothetical protein